VEREVAESHVFEKAQPRCDFAHDIASNVTFASVEIELRNEARGGTDGEPSQLGDRAAAKTHGERLAIEPCAVAIRTGFLGTFVPLVPPYLVAGLLFVESAQLQPRAVARRAPAVLRVEREQPRVEFGVAAVALRARALGREDRDASVGSAR